MSPPTPESGDAASSPPSSLLETVRRHATGRLGAEAAFVAVGLIVTILGQAGTLRIVSTYLSRASFGSFALANSALALPQSVLFGSLFVALVRRVPEAVRVGFVEALIARTHEIARPVLGCLTVLGVLGAVVLYVLHRGGEAALVISTVALSYATYRSERTQNLEHGARLRGTVALHRGLDLVARGGFAWIVLLWWRSPVVPLLCFSVGALAANAAFERRVIARLAPKAEVAQSPTDARHERRTLLQLGMPLVAATIFSWALTNTDRWFVERFVSLEAAALYVAAAQVSAIPFTVLAALLGNLAGPILNGKADGDPASARRWVHRIALGYFVASACGWGLLALLRRFVVQIVLGRALWDAAELIPLVSAGWALIHLSTIYHLGVVAAGRTRQLLLPNVVSAIAAVTVHVLLIPSMGAAGAGWGLIAGGVVRVIALAWANELAWRQTQT